jgi:predicted ATPase
MIRRFRVANFKSLVDVSVDLSPITVLIGRSGSGKTNFIDALRLLRDYLKLNAQAINAQGGWQRVGSSAATGNKTLRFEVEFDFDASEERFHYTLSLLVGGNPALENDVAEERLALGGRVLFHQQNKTWATKPEGARTPAPGRTLLDKIPGVQEIAVAFRVLSEGIGCYDFPGDVLVQKAQAGGRYDFFDDKGLNFVPALSAIQNDIHHLSHWKQILAALRNLNPSVKTIDLDRPNPTKVDIVHAIEGTFLNLDVSQESEGLRRFLAHLIALYQGSARSTLAFDEPEKGIYPWALSVLADEFKACAETGRGQLILATHSPQLLDHFEPEAVRVVEMVNYATRIGPLAPDQLKSVKERLMTAGELLTVDPARIETSVVS